MTANFLGTKGVLGIHSADKAIRSWQQTCPRRAQSWVANASEGVGKHLHTHSVEVTPYNAARRQQRGRVRLLHSRARKLRAAIGRRREEVNMCSETHYVYSRPLVLRTGYHRILVEIENMTIAYQVGAQFLSAFRTGHQSLPSPGRHPHSDSQAPSASQVLFECPQPERRGNPLQQPALHLGLVL